MVSGLSGVIQTRATFLALLSDMTLFPCVQPSLVRVRVMRLCCETGIDEAVSPFRRIPHPSTASRIRKQSRGGCADMTPASHSATASSRIASDDRTVSLIVCWESSSILGMRMVSPARARERASAGETIRITKIQTTQHTKPDKGWTALDTVDGIFLIDYGGALFPTRIQENGTLIATIGNGGTIVWCRTSATNSIHDLHERTAKSAGRQMSTVFHAQHPDSSRIPRNRQNQRCPYDVKP